MELNPLITIPPTRVIAISGGGCTDHDETFCNVPCNMRYTCRPTSTVSYIRLYSTSFTKRRGRARRRLAGLYVRLDGLVLRVEVGHVHHQVLHNKHVRQRRDLGDHVWVALDFCQARQAVGAINVHGARAADALPATYAELYSAPFTQQLQRTSYHTLPLHGPTCELLTSHHL